MKKISTFLNLLFLMFILTSCQTTLYNIEYYINGEEVELLPNTYLQNQYLILPIPELEEGQSFSGWYDNIELSGKRIDKLTNQLGDLKLYGEIYEDVVSTYNINYYINGKKVELYPKTYQTGESFNLPVPILNEGETFNGWYNNIELTGNEITNVSNQTGDLTFYAEIGELIVPPELNSLEQAFNYTSYTFELECEGSVYYSLETFYVDNDKYHQSSTYGDYYLQEVNNISYCYFEEEGKMYYMTEEDDDYNYIAEYLFTLDLSSIDTSIFKNKGEYYTVDENYLDEVGLLFTGYEEEVLDFRMYIVDNKLSNITLETIYEDDEYSYNITFSDFGTTKVEIPEAEYYYENNNDQDTISISDVYSLSKGEYATIEGVVTGIYGNNFYLSDNNKGILVYMSNNTEFNSLIKIGTNLSVTGEVDIYKTVHQIKNVTSIFVVNEEYSPKKVELDNVKQTTLGDYVNDIVSIYGLEIFSLPSSYPTSGSDVSFKCTYDGIEVIIFISKHLSSTDKNELYNVLKTLQKGSIIDFENVHVSYYDKYQIVLTSSAEIYKNDGVVTSKGLVLSTNEVDVSFDTELADILSKVTVYEKYSDGSKVELKSNEYTVDTDGYEKGQSGTFSFVYKYGSYSVTCKVTVRNKPGETIKVEIDESPMLDVIGNMAYDDYDGTTYGVNIGLPSIGTPKILVIPIAFTDAKAPANMVSDLEKAFFGTSSETGWESLRSYYYKSSYGLLDISGTVLDPYNTGKSTTYYENLYRQYLNDLEAYENYETDVYPDSVEYEIIKEVLEYYDNQIDYNDYDFNNDGYIDSIYLVYVNEYEESDDSFWWAYTNEYLTDDYEYYDDVEADFYVFMSYEFLFDELSGKTVKYNAETIIHETGHLLGLDDYYDYDSSAGPDGGIGGGDMMDYNVGDHNGYSKLILGWIDPYIVDGETTTITLGNFSQTGDLVCIFKDYNGTFFDEYYIIDFYNPDGVNETCAGDRGLFSEAGIRIYHIDATLNNPADCWSIYELTKYNNSYTNRLLIKLIEADGRNDILNNGYSENSDLFSAGEVYTNIKWYDNSNAGFSIKVNYIENGSANITIEYN